MLRMNAIVPCAAIFLACLSSLVLAAAAGAPAAPFIESALADPHRPVEDRTADAERRPAQCLAFAGVTPGSRILELVPGSGYYTRILSATVGPRGRVYAVAPPRRADAPIDAPEPAAPVQAIARDLHYRNVTVLTQSAWTVVLPQPVDLAWTSLNYHDFHNVAGLDVRSLNDSVWRNLRPGGTYLIIDHAAASGSGLRDTGTLHRIDAETVVAEVDAAGFKLLARGRILANTQDAHDRPVFGATIRGHTDQFMLIFGKPQPP